MLGSERSRVSVYDRGGRHKIGEFENLLRLQYDRARDDISIGLTAMALDDLSAADSRLLESVHAGRHEMVVHRADERVWEGPITRLAFTRNTCTIEARDVMHYVYRTLLRRAYNNSYPNIEYTTIRAQFMLNRELARKEALDPPINVLPYLDVRTVLGETSRTSRNTPAYSKTLWEDIDDMAARSGMDYTVVGRRIVLFDTHIPLGRVDPLGWNDFLGELTITEYAMDLATYSAVTDGNGLWGAVGGADPYYGLVEILETVYEEETTQATSGEGEFEPPTQAELISQARRNIDGRNPTPTIIRLPDQSQINPDCAVSYSDLVPGIQVPLVLDLPYKKITQLQKLDKVRVTQNPEQGERISVTLSPWPDTQQLDESSVGGGD